jgi:polysaccharide deacetylase family protein (PEP-CTERM system associated)
MTAHTVTNALSIDVEEHFQVTAFDGLIDRDQWPHFPSRVVQNTRRILNLLDEFAAKATFFVLGWVAERNPGLVREIADRGHEIASHGYWHRLVYQQTPEEFRDDVARSLAAINRACPDTPVLGYRAPTFSITEASRWAWPILTELGFQYDSSVFPTSLHDRYGIRAAPRYAHKVAPGLWEFPLSVVRRLGKNWPVAGGGYFRLYPLWLTRRAITSINAQGHPAIVYLHPWEFDPQQPRMSGLRATTRLRHYLNLHKTENRLRSLLARFRFGTMQCAFAASLAQFARTKNTCRTQVGSHG